MRAVNVENVLGLIEGLKFCPELDRIDTENCLMNGRVCTQIGDT